MTTENEKDDDEDGSEEDGDREEAAKRRAEVRTEIDPYIRLDGFLQRWNHIVEEFQRKD